MVGGWKVAEMKTNPVSPASASFDRAQLADCDMPRAPQAILSFLSQHGVTPSGWGSGASKPVDDLLDELVSGESRLVLYAGQLMRAVELVKIAVTAERGDRLYRLVEDRQVFSSEDRVRRRPTAWAVWEKLSPGEVPHDGAKRGLQEELQLSAVAALDPGEVGVTFEPAQDYPGLPTIAFAHAFEFRLPPGLFRPSGFAEVGRSKTTYFHWIEVAKEAEARGEQLFALPCSRLRELRMQVAAEAHVLGVQSAAVGFRGLQLAEALSVGRVGDALASFDGASGYVRGALYPVQFSQLGEDAEEDCPLSEELGQIVEHLSGFAQEKFLPGEMIVANHGVLNPPYGVQLALQVGRKRTEIHINTSAHGEVGAAEWRMRAKEVVAILTLEMLREQLATRFSPRGNGASIELAVDPEIEEISRANADLCQALFTAPGGAGARVVVGESFTFGKLASYLHAVDSSLLDKVYGWYAPEFKWAVGIPEEALTDERIATPETAIRGAEGLLLRLAPNATVAVATTGWCNVKGELPDHFSVAVARFAEHGGLVSKSLQVTLVGTQRRECGFVRRNITRELGVTAALQLLAQMLNHPEVEQRAAQVLSRYAEAR